MRRGLCWIVGLAALGLSTRAAAQVSTSSVAGPGAPRFEPAPPGASPPPPLPAVKPPPSGHDPAGSVLATGLVGISTGSAGTSLVIGAGVGYAVFDGLVPGARGLAVLGGQLGGELALTLAYTIPADWYVTPFLLVEGGRRWLDDLSGWIVGAGGGLRLGYPWSRLTFRVGWIYRRFLLSGGGSLDASAPIIGIQLRF